MGLAFLTCSCGDKIDPGLVEPPVDSPSDGATANPNAATETTGTSPTAGTTTAGSTTAGGTTAGGSTAGDTTAAAPAGLCGTSASTISYATHVATVFKANCISCHAPGKNQSSFPVDTYSNAKNTFKTTDAQSRVDSGNMPLTGKMGSTQVCIVDAWVTGGYQP
ncbi:MAG: hypothetical protein EOO40_10115 [Deltaproteobacteria bacterium]|nr:MAG: hypothetical protein EOO40_10115 [Deltaproteobacteria bacterium]